MQAITIKDGLGANVSTFTADSLGVKTKGEMASFLPGFGGHEVTDVTMRLDDIGNLHTRSQVLTDEGGFRINFANASTWASVGTMTWTNGSNTVTGTGFLALDMNNGDYIRLDSDGGQYDIVHFTDTEITLDAPYSGTTGTGASSRSKVKLDLAGDSTLTVTNGQALFTSGVNANQISYFSRLIDVPSLVINAQVALSQRVANASFYIGFGDNPDPTLAKSYAWFLFDGTTATTAKLVSARNPVAIPTGGEIQTSALTITTTATASEFRLELLRDRAQALQADTLRGVNKVALPAQSDEMYMTCAWVNGGTAPASTTTATIDFIQVANNNELAVSNISREPQPVLLTTGTATIGALTANQSVNAAQWGGTNAVNGGVSGLVGVGGSAANSAAATGNPVQTGGVVGTGYDTTYGAGDAARFLVSTSQQLVVTQGSVPEQTWQYAAAAGGIINTADVAIRAAGAAGVRNYTKTLTLSNASAVVTEFVVKDGASTVIWREKLPANMPSTLYTFDPPLRGTAATVTNVACLTTGAAVYCNATGYLGA